MRVDKILERNEKKLVISQFLPSECKEIKETKVIKDEKTGEEKEIIIYEENDYITIKKIPYDIKTKMKFIAMKSFGGNASKEILKKCRAKGIKISEIEKLNTENSDEIMDFILDIDYKEIETNQMANATLMIEQYILDYGIDKAKHTLMDEKGEPIELNYETLNNIGNENLIKYIIDNIKEFSKGFMLGE